MSLPKQQSDKKFLLFETSDNQSVDKKLPVINLECEYKFWSDRILLIDSRNGEEFHYFTAFDLLMNKSIQIRFRKTYNAHSECRVYPLNKDFGIIIEHYPFDFFYINFVKINWDTHEFEVIRKLEGQNLRTDVIVDKSDPSRFVLRQATQNVYMGSYQICKLVNEKIETGEIHRIGQGFDIYSKNSLIGVKMGLNLNMCVYDLSSKKERRVEIDRSQLPENVWMCLIYVWVNERLYVKVKFQGTEKYGFVWADLETKQWNLMNFETDFEIRQLKYFNGNLIVEAKEYDYSKKNGIVGRKIYSIPMRRPNYLRYLAWLLVVNVMKNYGEKDPYKAAKEFLPLNSDLREHWFKDEEKVR